MFTFRRKQKNKHIVITDAVVTVKKRDYIILKPTGDLDISILIYPERFPAMQFEQDGLVTVTLEYGDVTAVEHKASAAEGNFYDQRENA